MSFSFLSLLCCPFCGVRLNGIGADQFVEELEYSVLSCQCGRYPIVAGIPILKKGIIGTGGQEVQEIVELIEARRYREALVTVLLPPTPASVANAPASVQALRAWQEHAVDFLTDPETAICDLVNFYYREAARWDYTSVNYFLYRFSQPRYPVALSLANIIHEPQRPILDLACGVGQITNSLIFRAKAQPVIGLDRNFFFLYLAKNRLASKGKYVCCEADRTLPFRDGVFSTSFCSDAFHVFVNKFTCIQELKRVIQPDGVIILASLKTTRLKVYENLVADMPHRLIASGDILFRYLQRQGPSLTRQSETEHLAADPWLSVVASYRHELFRDYGPFEEWPHANGNLSFDPIYRREKHDEFGNVHLRRVFPSTWYEQENAECRFKDYQPETVCINERIVHDMAQGNRTPEVERLVGQCVILSLPDRYISASLSFSDGYSQPSETVGGTFYIDTLKVSNLIAALIPPGHTFIMADENKWRVGEIAKRCAIPFLERNGEYWGIPPDDKTAISELERLRQTGATFIVFGEPALWWLEYYAGLGRYLYSKFRCVLQNERLVVFDLRS